MCFERLIFNILSTDLSTGPVRGRGMGYRSNSRAELCVEASFQQRQFRPRARDILISWTGSRNTTGHWRKLSKTLPISTQPKFVTTEPFGLRTKTPDHDWLV